MGEISKKTASHMKQKAAGKEILEAICEIILCGLPVSCRDIVKGRKNKRTSGERGKVKLCEISKKNG